MLSDLFVLSTSTFIVLKIRLTETDKLYMSENIEHPCLSFLSSNSVTSHKNSAKNGVKVVHPPFCRICLRSFSPIVIFLFKGDTLLFVLEELLFEELLKGHVLLNLFTGDF